MKKLPYLTGILLTNILWFVLLAINACSVQPQISPESINEMVESKGHPQRIKVLATTSIVADVVSEVGDDLIELSILLPPSADPHTFDPNPSDLVKLAEADVIFANGAGLEVFLQNLIESAGAQEKVVPVSEGVKLLDTIEGHDPEHERDAGVTNSSKADPHTWTDPGNVKIWVENILHELNRLDPVNASAYSANADSYQKELDKLDGWIRDEIKNIPQGERKLVTDHTLFTYFADEYGFSLVGAVVPGYSTMAEPSAKELAGLEDAIQQLGVKAVFVGNTVNPNLAERIADDTGISLVFIYTGSLSDPSGEAGSYLDYMRYNVNAIVEALTN